MRGLRWALLLVTLSACSSATSSYSPAPPPESNLQESEAQYAGMARAVDSWRQALENHGGYPPELIASFDLTSRSLQRIADSSNADQAEQALNELCLPTNQNSVGEVGRTLAEFGDGLVKANKSSKEIQDGQALHDLGIVLIEMKAKCEEVAPQPVLRTEEK